MVATRASQFVFALTMIAIGAFGLVAGGFAPIWGGVPHTLPDREMLAYLCTLVSLACGAGLLVKRTAAPAAFILLVYLIIWTALFKFPFILRAPLVEGGYQTTGENVVLISGAWALYASTATKPRTGLLGFVRSETGLRMAYGLFGLALIAFGLSHFAYLDLTTPLVPRWLGPPVFWAYLTGCIYLLSGFAIATGVAMRAGAILAAIQIALITLLVWGPMVAAGQVSDFNRQEAIVSWALTVAAWVVAASLGGRPWFHRFGRKSRPLAATVEHMA